jgi:O-antigen/teichoic acid export membrane protein
MSSLSSRALIEKKAYLAGLWSSGGQIFLMVLKFGSHFILAKFLGPEVFGLFAVLWAVMTALYLFTDFGFSASIVQNKEPLNSTFLNTIWTMQVVKGVGLSGVALLMSIGLMYLQQGNVLPNGSVYSEPLLPYLLMAMGLVPLIGAFESTNSALAQRELNQKALFKLELYSQLVGSSVTLGMAYATGSAWAIVVGVISGSAFRMALSHFYLGKSSPKFELDRKVAAGALRYGGWILLGSIFGFVSVSGDKLAFGLMTDQVTLGCYSVALLLIGAFKDVVSRWLSTSLFPMFAEIQRQAPDQLPMTLRKTQWYLDVAMSLGFSVFYFFGDLIVRLIYDSRYASAEIYIGIAAFSFFQLRLTYYGQLWMAKGDSKTSTYLIGILAFFVFLFMAIGYSAWGFLGAVWGVSLVWPAGLLYCYAIQQRAGLLSLRTELSSLLIITSIAGLGWLSRVTFNAVKGFVPI